MEFLVEFDVNVPEGTSSSVLKDREAAEASAAAKLVDEGHLLRVWGRPAGPGENRIIGLYRTETEAELESILGALPLYAWMHVVVTRLDSHPNDPAADVTPQPLMTTRLPDPRLTRVYRLEAVLGKPLVVGDLGAGQRRIVPLTGGTFSGPQLNGTLLPGASADWQIVQPDGTALGDIRYTLQTDAGDLLYVQSRGIRHGSAEVLARLARGEDVDAGEYTFRTSTQIETAATELDWLNQGVFVSVGGRSPAGVIYETYLVA
jgi:muconolactone delta-isomerase